MNKSEIRQLLRDIKVAALLGRPEAIDTALNGLLAFPGVAANAALEPAFILKVLLPVGNELASLPAGLLETLQDHPLATGRAIAASALAYQYFKTPAAPAKALQRAAGDPRLEVRQALGESLAAAASSQPERLVPLVQAWLTSQPTRGGQQTGLICLPAATRLLDPETWLSWLKPLAAVQDPETRAILADGLQTLAQQGQAEAVLELFTSWAELDPPPTWVMTRALAAAWAVQFPAAVRTLLENLQAKSGPSSEISNAWRALERHGLPRTDETPT